MTTETGPTEQPQSPSNTGFRKERPAPWPDPPALTEQPQAVATTDTTMLRVIQQAAADPKCDVDKMERLLAMAETMDAKRRAEEFHAALSEVQRRCPVIEKTGRITYRGGESIPYAKIEDIQAATKPLLLELGFSTRYHEEIVDGAPAKRVTITLTRGGHSESCSVLMPLLDEGGGKNKAQGFVSANSYGRRAALRAILDITAMGEDDDGAGGAEPITDEQAMQIEDLLADVGADRGRFLKWVKSSCHVDKISDILDRDYERVVEKIQAKRAAK